MHTTMPIYIMRPEVNETGPGYRVVEIRNKPYIHDLQNKIPLLDGGIYTAAEGAFIPYEQYEQIQDIGAKVQFFMHVPTWADMEQIAAMVEEYREDQA